MGGTPEGTRADGLTILGSALQLAQSEVKEDLQCERDMVAQTGRQSHLHRATTAMTWCVRNVVVCGVNRVRRSFGETRTVSQRYRQTADCCR